MLSRINESILVKFSKELKNIIQKKVKNVQNAERSQDIGSAQPVRRQPRPGKSDYRPEHPARVNRV